MTSYFLYLHLSFWLATTFDSYVKLFWHLPYLKLEKLECWIKFCDTLHILRKTRGTVFEQCPPISLCLHTALSLTPFFATYSVSFYSTHFSPSTLTYSETSFYHPNLSFLPHHMTTVFAPIHFFPWWNRSRHWILPSFRSCPTFIKPQKKSFLSFTIVF